MAQWDAERLMRLFRERLLKSLLDKHAISQELVKRLLAWRHPGFSAQVGESIAASDKQRLENTAAYLHLGLRPPENDKPPPPREILRVAEYGEGWGVPASSPRPPSQATAVLGPHGPREPHIKLPTD